MNPDETQNNPVAAVPSSDELGGWLPIETAPKDRHILVWGLSRPYVAIWVKNLFTDHESWAIADLENGDRVLVDAFFWRPLPLPPIAA